DWRCTALGGGKCGKRDVVDQAVVSCGPSAEKLFKPELPSSLGGALLQNRSNKSELRFMGGPLKGYYHSTFSQMFQGKGILQEITLS
ncbi:hypothetical protein TNCV_1942491, partial [Trichonephila clavipes]